MSTGAEHGGAFWSTVGADFGHLEQRHVVINANVLDAWFLPSPRVIEALKDPADWIYRTSPPTDGAGMIGAICQARGLRADQIALGAGSSDIIFRALGMLFGPDSRALVPELTYSEYAHVLQEVIGSTVDLLPLRDWKIDLEAATARLADGSYNVFILVNPNSPTGDTFDPAHVRAFISKVPLSTMVWIDEAYADYAGITCEPLVTEFRNVVVVKSLSKVYALSGLRAGYLVGHPDLVTRLRLRTPPWAVSLPAQIAAVKALGDRDYYSARFEDTRGLRVELAISLSELGGQVLDGRTNYVLWLLPPELDANTIADRCQEQGLFLRRGGGFGPQLANALRVSVKDGETQARMLDLFRSAAVQI